jgi:hypothetical protein
MCLSIRDMTITIRDFTLQCLLAGGQELPSAEVALNKKSDKKKCKRR